MSERYTEYGAILPCGGRGNRLRELTGDSVPKSLVKVGDKELIRYSIDILQPELVKSLVLAVDYKADVIRHWVESFELPYVVHISEQTEPGVLGSIVAGANYVSEDSMVACNTDEVRLGFDLVDVIRFHEKHDKLATMVTAYANQLYRHRLIEIRERDNVVLKTTLKSEEYKSHPEQVGLINTGFLVIEKRAIDYFDSNHSRDWGGIIDPLCDANQLGAYVAQKIIYFNVGTPEEYRKANEYLEQNS